MSKFFKILPDLFLTSVVLALVVAVFPTLNMPDVTVYAKKRPSTTAMIEYRRQEAQKTGQSYRAKRRWRSLKSIPVIFQKAVIFNEDANFYFHEGIDWEELRFALENFIFKQKSMRGASTLTQQLAKNLFLSPDRTMLRKLNEYWLARELESVLSKKRILELYLNTSEWGPGIFGCDRAARYWYKRDLSRLSADELIALASILPAPLKWSPLNPSRRLRKKIVRSRKMLIRNGYIRARSQSLIRKDDVIRDGTKKVPDQMRRSRAKIDSLGIEKLLPH